MFNSRLATPPTPPRPVFKLPSSDSVKALAALYSKLCCSRCPSASTALEQLKYNEPSALPCGCMFCGSCCEQLLQQPAPKCPNCNREFWKEGVKKHVALANVAATCYERLVSCLTQQQQEDIRQHVLKSLSIIEDASLGACDARVLSQFYSQEDECSGPSHPSSVVQQTQLHETNDQQQQQQQQQSQYVMMTQASMSHSQREKELQRIDELLAQQQQQLQQQQCDDMTDDDAPMIPTASPCPQSPDMASAPAPLSPPPSRLNSVNSRKLASSLSRRSLKAAQQPAPPAPSSDPSASAARMELAHRGVSKTRSLRVSRAKADSSNDASEAGERAIGSTAAALADASRGSSRRSRHRVNILLVTGFGPPQRGELLGYATRMGWSIVKDFGDDVTHVIVPHGLGAPRTLNYYLGVAAGCWIVTSDWLAACSAGKMHVPEDTFEVEGDRQFPDFQAPMRSRLSRSRGCPLLLKGFSVYCNVCQDREKVLLLLRLAGATLLREPPKEHDVSDRVFQLGDEAGLGSGSVSIAWLFDSISTWSVQQAMKYI